MDTKESVPHLELRLDWANLSLCSSEENVHLELHYWFLRTLFIYVNVHLYWSDQREAIMRYDIRQESAFEYQISLNFIGSIDLPFITLHFHRMVIIFDKKKIS